MRYPLAGLVAATLGLPCQGAITLMDDGQTQVSFGGFAKASLFYSHYSDGKLPSGSIGRQFYVAGTIPVCDECDSGKALDFSARETRLVLASRSDLGRHRLGTRLEMDFLGTPNGNEMVSNSYTPRLRHAYFTFDDWLFGQTFTTFQDTAVLPESVDFLGPAEGTVFQRQVQVRYRFGSWQFALENPETVVTPHGEAGKLDLDDGLLPDMVARYDHHFDGGHLSLAAIGRQLRADEPGLEDSAFGYGLSLAGRLQLGARDDLSFMATHGDGLGRYVALNAVADALVSADGELKTLKTISGFISYRHWWNDQWRSSLVLSALRADQEPHLVDDAITRRLHSLHANLFYSPVKALSFGVEYLLGQRQLENGARGNLNRLQFAAKYSF
ncbi:DcaP family trimeric outer membrane transporter [Gallaecimonas sp. GXIMD4217]|uniref:DcaP family trimeric outer membrane transporter n=1 Tax=Gallaecimonas sp. GXIMD4217 TaxID=3131927 RepID=UPI00311B0861